MSKKTVAKIKPTHILGFSGNVMEGLCMHPSLEYIIYPIVTNVVIQSIKSKEQYFLENENPGEITAVACSNSGKYVAAGYLPYPGFKAVVNLWDFQSREHLSSYDTHKDRIHSLKFSFCDNFILSVGGYGEDNNLICYSIEDKEIYCGCNAASNTCGDAFVLHILRTTAECVFVTGGENTIRFWRFHAEKKFLEFVDVSMSKYKRKINCFESNERNTFLYCGTNSGDFLKIKMKDKTENDLVLENTVLFGCFGKKIKRKITSQFSDADRYVLGITVIKMLNVNQLMIGCGGGQLEIVEERALDKPNVSDLNPERLISPTLPVLVEKKKLILGSRITTAIYTGNQIIVGTEASEILFTDLNLNSNSEKFISAHTADINDLVFPYDYSVVFATACNNSIDLWSSDKCNKLLSIVVEGSVVCNGICFLKNGEAIVSIWKDGRIRMHTPVSGRLIYEAEKPLKCEPSVIAIAGNCGKIITGNTNGEIHFWKIFQFKLDLLKVEKKHKNKVNAITVNLEENLCLSAGNEGLCILWDLNDYNCKAIISCLTICHTIKFHPSKQEFITCGKDKKLRIWSMSGSLVKEIEVSKNSVNCFDLTSDGKLCITGGCDVKVWNYEDKFKLLAVGESADIFKMRVSPDHDTLLTVCDKRRISVWKIPRSFRDF